jgi:hypothetical protein
MIESYLKQVFLVRKNKYIEEYPFLDFVFGVKDGTIMIDDTVTMITQEGVMAMKHVADHGGAFQRK